jgi:TP901 family phage tail tape measure protein
MAGVAKGIIDIQINTGSAATELKALQNQINSFNAALAKGNLAQGKFASDYTKDLSKAINASGLFTSEFMRMNSAAANLDSTLKKGKGTLGQFFSSAFNKNSAGFAATMDLAARRASTLQTQFINTGASAKGMGEALAIRPLDAFSSKAAIAAERQALLNTMFRQGTTHMINFGKNVQWAGRQLMVGFTVPLTVLGTVAGRTFMDIEKQLVNLKKVYGDTFTTPEEINQNIAQVRQLSEEFTKYGIAVKDTIGLAAQAAASGARNGDLVDATRQATRLATLGQMDQNEALKTTIALQSAFRLSGEDLADTINFLNMVENQTVVSLQDLSAAIPRVAPVIKGLGGDVRDMSVFLAAMQEGGVSAEQGANALKSGLASLINPTKAATETLSGFGINLDKIISTNRGDLMGTVFAFGQALKGLDDFSKQQALEKVFGKYQYARLGALFENIVRDGSQASQVLSLMEYDVTALRATAEKELSAVENALGTQLIGAVERLKLSLEPIGKIFIEMAIPVVNFLTKIVEKFDGLSDGQKKFAAIAAVIVGVVVPAGTMFLGLLINLLGTLGKITHGFGIFGKALIKGGPVAAVKALTQSTKYLSIEELEAAGAARQLASSTEIANAAMLEQATSTGAARNAVAGLVAEYRALIAVQQQAAATRPGLGVAAAAGAAAGKTTPIRIRGLRRNSGGEIFMSGGTTVPGMGNTDTVPAMLTPGEFVINKEATKNNLGLLHSINDGKTPQGLNSGGMAGVQYLNIGNIVRAARMARAAKMGKGIPRRSGAFGSPEVEYSSQSTRRKIPVTSRAAEERLAQDMQEGQASRVPRPISTQRTHFDSNEMISSRAQYEAIKRLPGSKIGQGSQKDRLAEILLDHDYPVKALTDDWANFSTTINQAARRNTNTPRSIDDVMQELRSNPSAVSFTQGGRDAAFLRVYPGVSNSQFVDDLNRELLAIRTAKGNVNITDDMLNQARNTAYPNMRGAAQITGLRLPAKSDLVDIANKDLPPGNKISVTDRNVNDRLNEHFIKNNVPLRAGPGSKLRAIDSNGNTLQFKDRNGKVINVENKFGGSTEFNKGGAVGGMQYFGARMPNRVVKSSQIKKFTGQKIEDSAGHSSRFQKLAGVYDVNGRKMFVKPFSTLEEAQAELIGNAARRRIAGTATPGSRIVRMDGPEGEIFATTAPMIPGMKPGSTLPTKELLKQIPASSMLGDMDATAGNILSTGGGRLVTVDPGAAGVKLTRNSKGVFRRATGSEISFGSEATNTGAYTAKAITQVLEKTGASKDFVKMLGDSIAREGLTKAQFTKMYDDAVESSISRVSAFKLPSRVGDRTKLDEAAKAAGYRNADEAYSAIMLRDLTSIRGLGGDIYSSASKFQGMLKANSGTLVPGMGNTDTVPAMLTPGEFVVNKEATGKNLPLLQSINDGNVQGFNKGGMPGVQYFGTRMPNRKVKDLPRSAQRGNQGSGQYPADRGQGRGQDFAGMARERQRLEYEMAQTSKRLQDSLNKVSMSNTAYANVGAKYTMLRENVEKQVMRQQLIHTDRMVGINANLAKIGPTMAAGTNLLKTTMANGAKSMVTATSNYGKSLLVAAKALPSTISGAMAGRGAGISQAMMMGSMIPMMASSTVEDPKKAQALMGAGAAMSIIPMLASMGPVIGGVVAALGLLGGAFYMIRKHVDGLSKSSAIAGSNMGGAANRMETMAQATGYGFASTRSGNADFRFTEKQAQNASEIMPYFDTDEGKKLIEEMKKLSSQQRYEKVASMLTFAIADGMSPDKAEAFGSSIAFALDDALLKSKVIALIKSGTLESGSQAMINEINKRQQSLGNDIQDVKSNAIPEASSPIPGVSGGTAIAVNSAGPALMVGGAAGLLAMAGATAALGASAGTVVPVIGTAVGLVAGLAVGLFKYNKAMDELDKQIEVVGKTFGSSIQTIKELNNAESLLREERKNGTISLEDFEAREKQIEEMRNTAYENISAAVVNLPDAGAASQAVSDQLQLGGFEKDNADLIARQTDRDKVSAEMFQKSFDDLDANQKEIIGKVVASTLDGITPENYATKLDDIKNVWALYKEALLEKTKDGVAVNAQEMQSLFEESQLKNFVSSLNIPGGGGSPLNPDAASQQMQAAIESSGTTL